MFLLAELYTIQKIILTIHTRLNFLVVFMSGLKGLLSSVYRLSDEEASTGADSLVSFFKELHKINARLEKEKLIKEKQSNIDVNYDKNNGGSKRSFDNKKN